jgi:hypothetical protein
MSDISSTASAERQLGRFFGWTGIAVACASAAIAVIDGERYWIVGWLGAYFGWLLTGACCMSLGEARARYLAAEEVEERRERVLDSSST